jgi:hypothetical protein
VIGMTNTKLCVFVITRIAIGLIIQSNYAQSTTTITDSIILIPGAEYTNFVSLSDLTTSETYSINLLANASVRFWIMDSSEYDLWENYPGYIPTCLLNISTIAYSDDSFNVSADDDYYYGLRNEGSTLINVTLITIRPGLVIYGFTVSWIFVGMLFLFGIIYYYRIKGKKLTKYSYGMVNYLISSV